MHNPRPVWVSPKYVENPKTGNIFPKVIAFSDTTVSIMMCEKCFNGEHKDVTHYSVKIIAEGDECYQDALEEATIPVIGFHLVKPSALGHPFIPRAFKPFYLYGNLKPLTQAEIDQIIGGKTQTNKENEEDK